MIEITRTHKIIILVVLMAVSFAAGRMSVGQPEVHTETKTDTQIDKKESEKTDKDTHTVTHVIVIKNPDGSEKTDTTTNTDVVTHQIEADATNQTIHQDTKTDIVPQKTGTLNISALASTNLKDPSDSLAFGIGVTKQFIGPITVGGFGFNNGIIGVSIGINF